MDVVQTSCRRWNNIAHLLGFGVSNVVFKQQKAVWKEFQYLPAAKWVFPDITGNCSYNFEVITNSFENKFWKICPTHFMPIFHFFTTGNRWKNQSYSNFFRGYRNKISAQNGWIFSVVSKLCKTCRLEKLQEMFWCKSRKQTFADILQKMCP